MPTLTIALVRAALAWLAVAFLLLGVVTAAPKLGSLGGVAGALGPAAVHLLVVGFISQMIFGVALWLFPRVRREEGRAGTVIGWGVLACLNAGLLLRLVAEPLVAFVGTSAWGRLLLLSAALQWLACLGFVALAWPRARRR